MAGKTRNEASSSRSGGGGSNRGESVVVDVGRRRSTCGYCRSGARTSISHGLWAHSITVDDYQDLLDRGWRRSGSFLYKPEMERTCCPSYTIRLRADDFVPSKEQLRVSKRMQRFQDGTLSVKKQDKINDGPKTSKSSGSSIHHEHLCIICQTKLIMQYVHALKAGKDVSSIAFLPKTIAEKLASSLNHMAKVSGMLIRACNGHINFYSARKGNFLSEGIQISSECPQGKRRKLEIRLKRSSFDPEEFALYRRYQIKVHNDTPEHVMESSYRRFLVDTPLVFVPPTGDDTVPPCGFGSFHQQYVIDGRLVAVGVIDILPRCLSSKYLFWDPDLAFLSLGKYSALQEIGWIKENQAHCPSLEYYYLGYYIHSCSKMRYKAAYRPSELLCPLRYQWVPFDIARPLLDRQPYVVLSDFAVLQNGESTPHVPENLMEMQHNGLNEEDANDIDDEEMDDADFVNSDDESDSEANGPTSVEIEDGDVSNVLIGLKRSCVRFKDLQHAFGPSERAYLETQLRRYMRAVGAEVAGRMVYSLG
ncbi:unnamed protein product, partial [Vitis vinifera]